MIDFLDSLTNWILTHLAFFASGLGLLTIGAIAVLIILFWDWRLTLIGLVIIQVGVIVLVTKVYQLPLVWSNVQFLVTTFVAGMLALSARQVSPSLYLQRPGSWLVRLCAVILLIVGWQFVDLELPLPLLTPQIEQLFLWLTVCSLILLGLSSSPLHTGVALLFWFIPIQVLVEILLPGYGLFVQIGMIELFVGLTCSYLLLAQRFPVRVVRHVLTDVAFPFDATPEPTSPRSGWAPRLENRLPSRASTEPLRRAPAQLPSRPLPIGDDQPERWHSDEESPQQLPDPLHSPSSEAHNRNGDGADDTVTTDQSR